MKLRPDQQRVKTLISDTITLLCKNGLNYDSEFCVEALIGITLDKSQVFLVNINETITKGNRTNHESNSSLKHRKRKVSEDRARFESLPNGVHNGENGISARKSPRTNDVTQTPASNNLLGDISINKLPITIVPDNETSTSKSGHPSTKTEEASVSEVFDLSLKPSRDSRESEPSSLHIISPDPNENDSQNHLVLTTDSGDDENNRSAHENGDSGNSREAYEPIGVGQPVWPGPEPTLSFAAAPDNLKPSSLAANQERFNQSQDWAIMGEGQVHEDTGSDVTAPLQQASTQPPSPTQSSNMPAPIQLENGKVACALCGKTFRENWMVRRHMLTHGAAAVVCPICHKRFKRKDTLKAHVDKTHGGVGYDMIASNLKPSVTTPKFDTKAEGNKAKSKKKVSTNKEKSISQNTAIEYKLKSCEGKDDVTTGPDLSDYGAMTIEEFEGTNGRPLEDKAALSNNPPALYNCDNPKPASSCSSNKDCTSVHDDVEKDNSKENSAFIEGLELVDEDPSQQNI